MGRSLSPNEHVLYLIDQKVAQHMVIVARIVGVISESVLRQALDIMQKKHPYLQWKIKDGKVPEFVSGVPLIPLLVRRRKDAEQWVEEAERQLNEFFPLADGPLARAVLLTDEQRSDLVMTICHIASDGMSVMPFMKDLLTLVGKLNKGESIPAMKTLPVPPPTLDVLRKDITFKESGEEEVVGNESRTLQITPHLDFSTEKRITRLIPLILPQLETKELVAKSRKKDTTVQGALCAAFFQAVVEEYRRPEDDNEPLMISCITPVNLRHLFTKSMEEDFGYYISFAVHGELVHEKGGFWELAHSIKETLHKEIEYGRDIQGIRGVAQLLDKYDNTMDLLAAIDKNNPPLIVTNLGRINIPEEYDGFKLEELNASGAIQAHTKLAMAITTFRGHLTINFLYSFPYISEQKATKIALNMMDRLIVAIREDE